MKYHTMIVKTLSEHIIIAILHCWVKNVVSEQKWFHLKTRGRLQKQQLWVDLHKILSENMSLIRSFF